MSAGIHHLHHKEQHPSKIRKRFPTISRKKIGSLGNLNLMGSRIISFFLYNLHHIQQGYKYNTLN
jgi:hypothetical protein